MVASEKIRDMIKEFEGLRLQAYQCSANKWTIGWGHTRRIKKGMKITEAEAQELFDHDIAQVETELNVSLENISLNQNQFDSLVSFVFNIGLARFIRSTMYRMLEQGCLEQAGEELGKWVYSAGKRSDGLIKRRKAEMALYFSKT